MPQPERFKLGEKLGRLTALGRIGKDFGLYLCDCGEIKQARLTHVHRGLTQSCGCLHKERTSEAVSNAQRTHGMYGTPTYAVWNSMRDRCTNPKSHAWNRYGGRGITTCKRWEKFENFLADMGPQPAGLTLERIKNNLGYSPSNCKWATRKEQNNNQDRNIRLTYQGKTQNITQWAEELGIDRGLLYTRNKAGWSVERMFTTPSRKLK